MKEFCVGRSVLLVAFFCSALELSTQSAALAATEGDRKRPSTELFDAGLEEMKAGHFESGCRLLEESLALEPLLGTLFTLGECEARRGRVETALGRFREFEEKVEKLSDSERASQARRLDAISERRRELEHRRSFLELRLQGALGPAHELFIDDQRIDSSALARPLPFDSGMHEVVVRLGERANRSKVELREGATVSLDLAIPEVAAPEPLVAPLSPAPPPARPPLVRDPPPLEPATAYERPKSWTYLSLGLGVVGLGVAGVSTFVLLSKKPALDENCPSRVCKNEAGLEAAHDVGTWNALGTIGAIGAIVGLGSFTYLILTEPADRPGPNTAFRFVPTRTGGTLSVEGTF